MKKRLVVRRRARGLTHWPSDFRMNNQQCAESCEFGHRLTQVRFFNMRKLVNTRGHKETFETDHACFKHRRQFSSIPRNDTTPKPDINKTTTRRCGQLGFKAGERCRGRNRVE